MKKEIMFLSLYLGLIYPAFSQHVGINNNDPQVSLDITGGLSTRSIVLNPVSNAVQLPVNHSFIVISNQDVTGPVTISDPSPFVDGRRLVIYNNSGYPTTFGTFQIANQVMGEFICQGAPTGWKLLADGGSNTTVWNTNGNAGTDPDTKFIGTTDDQALTFRTNNLERMRLTNEGLKIKDDLRLEFGHGIMNKPFGNGSIYYNSLGNFPTLDIYGAGNDFTGYDRRVTFWAQGGTTFIGGGSFGGNLSVLGELLPNGNSGEIGQVLTNEGGGSMKWDFPERMGQIIEVSPFTTDTSTLAPQGFKLMGKQTRTIQKTTANGGTIQPQISLNQVAPESHMFYYAAQEKLFVVTSGTVYHISLAESNYGALISNSTPSFDLNNTIPIFTGTKILIYPHFIFDCATGGTTTFPSNPCPGFTFTQAQVWTGDKLIIYGPGGGITFQPSTNIYTCIETGNGNLYYPKCSAIWTGSEALFYGGYLIILGDTISVDLGLKYNPSSNTWTDIQVGGPRIHGHQVLWTGTEMMIFGGRLDEFYYEGGVQFYNPVSTVWNAGYTPGSITIRTHKNTRSYISNQKVFAFNVLNLDIQTTTFSTNYFDLPTKTWISFTPTSRNNDDRATCASAAIGNDVFYFPSHSTCGFALNYLHFFILETNPIRMYPKYNANLITSVAKNVASSEGYVFAYGMLGGGLSYQISKKRWNKTTLTDQPPEREGHVCIQVGVDSFFVWGGKNGATYYNTGRVYNAATNIWDYTATINAPSVRAFSTAAVGGGLVMIWGGNAGGSYLNNGKLYNIATSTWTNISGTGGPTCTTFAYIDWDGTKFKVYCNGVYEYDPILNTWQFVYPDAQSNIYGSSGASFQININGITGNIYDKGNNIHYKMDGNGLEYVTNRTQFINSNDVFLPGNSSAQLYNATLKDFKFTELQYEASTDQRYPLLHKVNPTNFLIIGIRPSITGLGSCVNHFTDAMMIYAPNSGSPITRDIDIESLLYRKD